MLGCAPCRLLSPGQPFPSATPASRASTSRPQPRLFAGDSSYFDMAGPELSPDEALLAYGVDLAGGEVFTL